MSKKAPQKPAVRAPATSAEPRRILILTADAGFGHRSAANAVAEALKEVRGDLCQVDIVNPLEDKRAPFFLRDSQSDYDRIVREMPELYRFGYDASSLPAPSAIVESALTVLLFDVMADVLKQYRPDAILATYPLYQSALNALFAVNRRFVPLLTVVTDLVTVHRLWFNKDVSTCLVPNDLVWSLAQANGIRYDRIKITGIPVHPTVVREQRAPAEIRAELGWQPDLPTFLAVGSRRVERLMDTLNVLNHFGQPVQIAVAAGKDHDLYQSLNAMDWHVPVHIYEYASNIPTMMHAADAVICKAGGLIVTESLACGKPLMLVDVIPGQETGNAEYVVSNGAGELVQSPIEALEALSHWLGNGGQILRERARNAQRTGKPRAAYTTAELVWQAAEAGPVNRGRIAGRPRLVGMLNENHVDLEKLLSPGKRRRD